MRLAAVLVAALAAIAPAPGCGPSAKEQLQGYVTGSKPEVERVNTAYADIQSAFSSLSTMTDETWAAAAATLDRAAAAVQLAADNFEQLKPPDAMQSAHAQLIAGLRDLVKAFGVISTALKSGSFGPDAMSDPTLTKLLSDGNAKRETWKEALIAQCRDQGVSIPWTWQ